MGSGIRKKLNEFIFMYYRQQLVRGVMAWFALGLGMFGGGFLIEHFYWLGAGARAMMFWGLWIVWLLAMGFWVVRPWLKLRGVGKVLGYAEAAIWIGDYFPEVSDKLLNLLQLEDMLGVQGGNEWLMEGIEQKTLALRDVPFLQALDWGRHRKWVLRFGVLLLLLLGIGTYESTEILQGATRVFQYNKEFERKAPFTIRVLSGAMVVEEGASYRFKVAVEGGLLPDQLELRRGDQWLRMRKLGKGLFEYVFEGVVKDEVFGVRAMEYGLGEYGLQVLKQPHWLSVGLYADYPEYTGVQDGEYLQVEGVSVPEGTRLEYRLKGEQLKGWYVGRSIQALRGGVGQWIDGKGDGGASVYKHVAMSNQRLLFAMKGPQGLSMDTFASAIEVQKDEFPSIQMDVVQDTVQLETWYFSGVASDDYSVLDVQFLYRIQGRDGVWQKVRLFQGDAQQVAVTHALDLAMMGLKAGEVLEYQFAAKDNDGIRGGKTLRTPIKTLERMDLKRVYEQLEKQESSIGKGMNKTAKSLKELQKESQKLQESLQQNQSGWDQENKVKSWLNQQQKMVESLKQLEKKQEKVNQQKKSLQPVSEELQKKKEALNQRMKELTNPEMQKLIDEINRLMEQKANKEAIQEKVQKLNEMSQETSKELEKLMEQLKQLELEEALDQELEKMQEWIDREEALAKETESEKGKEASEALKEKQAEQNRALQEIDQGMQEIQEKNQSMEKPMDLKTGEQERKEAGEESQKASQDLQNNKKSAATEKMKKSAQKMKEVMKKLQEGFEQEQKKRMAEDYQALRALLENLIDASTRQEAIFTELKKLSPDNPKQVALNREQMRLKESLLFIEDSLMALAKRQTMISNFVTKEMGRVNVQMAFSLEKMKVRNPRSAAQHQQFVMTGLNNLAEMLMESLQNMQQQMSSDQKKEGDKSCDNPNKSGQGKQGKPKPGSKLSESQKALGEQLQKMQQQRQGKPGENGKPQGGSPQKPGESGEPSQRELNEDLAKMALMQEALRRQVEALRKELGQEGKQGMSNALQEVEKMMEQQEKDLVNGKVTPQSLERQKQIMTRLLEHERADRKQEQEDRRESNNASGYTPQVPPELEAAARKKASEREALRLVQPAFKPYYKQSVQKYLQIYSR